VVTVTEPGQRWELTITAEAEVIPGDPPEPDTEEPEEQS
jgi:hypothetical protein